MTSYLVIESRSDTDSPDVPALRNLVAGLRTAGHDIAVFLVQNGVMAVGASPGLAEIVGAGVDVWADGHSVAARGLSGVPWPDGVRVGGMSDLVSMLMTPGTVAVWH